MFKRLSFQNVLFIQYSLVVTIIISLSVTIFYQYIVKSIEETSIKGLNQMTIQKADQISSFYTVMDNISLQTMASPTVIDSMKLAKEDNSPGNFFERNPKQAYEVGRYLAAINGPNTTVGRISLYTITGDYTSMGIYPESKKNIDNYLGSKELKMLYDTLLDLGGKKYILNPHKDFFSKDEELKFISVTRMIKDLYTGKNYGIVQVQQPLSKLTTFLDFEEIESVKTILFSETGEVLATSSNINIDPINSSNKQYFLDTKRGKVRNYTLTNPDSNTKEVVSITKLDELDYVLAIIQNRDELFSSKKSAINILIFSGVSLFTVTLIVIYFMADRLTRPLKELKLLADEVTLNNLSLELKQTEQKNELRLLNKAFKEMFHRLNKSLAQEIKSNILALQSQMSPHFLYNTLMVISSTAEESNNERIMIMCYKLSEMLRYVLTYEETKATILDEVNHTKNYLDLMKYRYEDLFSYQINVNEAQAQKIKIPKLILQPIVENCFKHAFIHIDPPWIIELNVKIENRMWQLEIIDNGIGFDSEVLKEILENVEKTIQSSSHEIRGLGLVNTIQRLKFLYGKKFFFDISSYRSNGTKIILRGETNNDSSNDS